MRLRSFPSGVEEHAWGEDNESAPHQSGSARRSGQPCVRSADPREEASDVGPGKGTDRSLSPVIVPKSRATWAPAWQPTRPRPPCNDTVSCAVTAPTHVSQRQLKASPGIPAQLLTEEACRPTLSQLTGRGPWALHAYAHHVPSQGTLQPM